MLPMLLILAAPLAEPPPGHFYNRPGATPAMRDTALRRCRAITTRPTVETSRPLTPPIGTAPDLPRPRVRTTGTIGECMAMAGWNLYALTPREQARWRRLSEGARSGLLGGIAEYLHGRTLTAIGDGGCSLSRTPSA